MDRARVDLRTEVELTKFLVMCRAALAQGRSATGLVVALHRLLRMPRLSVLEQERCTLCGASLLLRTCAVLFWRHLRQVVALKT